MRQSRVGKRGNHCFPPCPLFFSAFLLVPFLPFACPSPSSPPLPSPPHFWRCRCCVRAYSTTAAPPSPNKTPDFCLGETPHLGVGEEKKGGSKKRRTPGNDDPLFSPFLRFRCRERDTDDGCGDDVDAATPLRAPSSLLFSSCLSFRSFPHGKTRSSAEEREKKDSTVAASFSLFTMRAFLFSSSRRGARGRVGGGVGGEAEAEREMERESGERERLSVVIECFLLGV